MTKFQKCFMSTVLAVTLGVTAKVNPIQVPNVLMFSIPYIERILHDDTPKK